MDEEALRRSVDPLFEVYEVRDEEDEIRFYGIPRVDTKTIYSELFPKFKKEGYKLELKTEYGEHVIVAKETEKDDSFPWTNVLLAVITLFTTLFAGSLWYSVDIVENPLSVIEGWPFALSVMTVLGAHEFGHYIMSRYHGVEATLPYFIPFPSFIGTMGAVIRVKGVIPNRKALFDIGVAGPLLGLVATVFVTAIGLMLDPIQVQPPEQGQQYIELHWPLMYQAIEGVIGAPSGIEKPTLNPNPVIIGGWVGMFITFLNLLPAGQLDGGHIVRSVFGDYAKMISYAVPVSLFGLGTYIEFVLNSNGSVWFLWGFMTLIVTSMGSAQPLEDSTPLGKKRIAIAILVVVLGIMTFTPVPISISQG